jgi:hypothetical protein
MYGLIYQIGKDIVGAVKGKFFDWNEETKAVDMEYIHKSGLSEKLEKEGYKLYWSTFDKVASKKLDGWEIIYEIDEENRTKYRLVVNNEVILIGISQ